MRLWSRFLRLAPALPIGLALVPGCHASPEPPPPRQAVRVESVTPMATQTLTVYSGSAFAQTQVDLAFKVGGYVQSVATTKDTHGKTRALQAGDHVPQGMILAALRESDYKARLAELSGMRSDAAAGYTRAKADLDRAQALFTSGSISRAELDNLKARYGQAAGAAAASNARVSGASISLSDTRLKAPFTGIVLTRNVEVGALVAPGASGFSIADTATMRVVFGVPDALQRTLTTDQTVTATTEGVPGRTFAGTISKIAVQADAKARVFEVEATIDNADQEIKVGMVMQVQVNLRNVKAASATLVPLSAIVRPPDALDGYGVFLAVKAADGDVAELRRVTLGELVTNRVEVTQGLTMNDRVVIQGATLLTNGRRVNVLP